MRRGEVENGVIVFIHANAKPQFGGKKRTESDIFSLTL
jgi:hypothetical protein